MDSNEQSIAELLKSINDSIEDMRAHTVKIDKLPSNFEILVSGITSNKAVDAIFSNKLDGIIAKLLENIQNGNIERILQDKELVEKTTEAIFGEKSFKGPVSNAILSNIQGSVQSVRYNTMRSALGKTGLTLKKIKFIIKNLDNGQKAFKNSPEELQKYKDAVYAIKQTLKFIAKVFRGRKIINRKVFDGLNNVVYESSFNQYDEPL